MNRNQKIELAPSAIQRQMYDNFGGSEFMRFDRVFYRRVELVREAVRRVATGKLLDIGCSNGAITKLLGPHELFGVDISDVSVAEALQNGVEARVGNLETELPFDDEAFDLVFSGETIEHTLYTDFFLSQCNRVLKEGGHLIITTPNVNSVVSFVTMQMLDLAPFQGARYRSPHVRDFTKRLLTYALRENGFEVVSVRGTWLGIPWPSALAKFAGPVDSFISYYVPRIAAGLVVVARKCTRVSYDSRTEIQENLHPW